MIVKYNRDKKNITIDMRKYIAGCIEEFQEVMPDIILRKEAHTLATENLFKVQENDNKNRMYVSKEQAKLFHSAVAKLLFVAKRGRPDVLLAISFLTTRVQKPDEDDWKKLLRVLAHLK